MRRKINSINFIPNCSLTRFTIKYVLLSSKPFRIWEEVSSKLASINSFHFFISRFSWNEYQIRLIPRYYILYTYISKIKHHHLINHRLCINVYLAKGCKIMLHLILSYILCIDHLLKSRNLFFYKYLVTLVMITKLYFFRH